jgi:hypothetical protein
MERLRSLGHHVSSNRTIFLLELDSIALPFPRPALPSRYFSCFSAMAATPLSADEIGGFSEHLLRAGCAYFCAWGPDCGRVHDIMDQVIVGGNPPESSFDDIMTTWHPEDLLPEALDFFFTWTEPYEAFKDECRTALIISVGSSEWSRDIVSYVEMQISGA